MAFPMPPSWVSEALQSGLVIPAHPLALTKERKLDERRQRALTALLRGSRCRRGGRWRAHHPVRHPRPRHRSAETGAATGIRDPG